jgi:hypothetical protein
MRKQHEEKGRPSNVIGTKRAYRSPKLIEYGSVSKLTATNGTLPPTDGGTGALNKRMGTCL